jgi:hypothetical protein
MHYCRPGPGCNVHAWRGPTGYVGTFVYFLRFGSALERMNARMETAPHLSTCDLNLFADALGALRRAGFLIPDVAFQRVDAEIATRDAAIADQKARQGNLFAATEN